MTLTLAALVRQREFGLRVLSGDDAVNRQVGWVHVSELADPGLFLRTGTLLLTTGLQLGPPGQYVSRLGQAGVVGIGFGVGLSHKAVPAGLLKACQDAGMPLVEVPLETRFSDITKYVADDMARTAVRAARSTADVERALIRSLAAPDVPGEIVRRLAQWLNGWAMLLDQDFRAVAAAPAKARRELKRVKAEIERVSPAGRFSLSWSADKAQVSVHPVDHMGGYLAVGTPKLTADGHSVIGTALSLLAFQADQVTAVRRAERSLRAAAATFLVHGLSDAAVSTGVVLPKPPVRVAIIRGDVACADLAAIVEREMPAALVVQGVDYLLSVFERQSVRQLAELLDGRGRAAVSEAMTWEKVPDAAAEVMKLSAALLGEGPVIVTKAEVLDRGLVSHVDTPEVRAYADALLAPLRAYESTVDLVGTLRTFLVCDGNWVEASARLEIHRHTLRYRLRKIEELLGRSLDATGTRAELWVALQLYN
ncbi:helix-turn-helix domain-containing protein [Kibdelosporangium phytohabitans]|uniref:helix-turn-helix domain-containing protein n=1 Tax=Kibdelosporangium phytohabitans TaxID=860235 RepID=UPI0014703884|nr:PucR family transcriptional regulator [Kibdelosporangium phytohabitans]MBE1468539.1 purine catabolism regulator [Kibdelosporangium phytohabitans]